MVKSFYSRNARMVQWVKKVAQQMKKAYKIHYKFKIKKGILIQRYQIKWE